MALIVYEDEHLLAVNKPAGWNTHAPSPFAGEGVYDWLKHRESRWGRLAIIHRLDKETSGILIFGKTPEANRSLTQQFEERDVRKKYLFLTDRPPQHRNLKAVSTLVRAGEKYVSRSLHVGAAHAETHFVCREVSRGIAHVEAEPITGRTHQIRVHAAEHGFPVLGDTLYGGTPSQRLFLHSAQLIFRHPITGQSMAVEAAPDWDAATPGDRSAVLRSGIVDPEETNAFRVVHGASEGWPGLYVDKLGDWLLALSETSLTDEQRSEINKRSDALGARGMYHKRLNRGVRRTKVVEASPQRLLGDPAPERFHIRENGLNFDLSFNEGYSVGLFLDQRDNRRRFLTNHVAAGFTLFPNGAAGTLVLNAFAYTCGFSVAATKAGALVTSVDLSKKYLEWGRRNFALNEIDTAQQDFIYGDAFDWMQRLTKKGRLFDCVVLDPPTFSQSKESGTWQAEKHFGKLVEAALPLLKSNGVLFASTNAAKLEPEEFLRAIDEAVTKSRRKIIQQHYVPQPPDFPITRAEPAYLKTVWLRIN